jgi:site-specific DNA recombinase
VKEPELIVDEVDTKLARSIFQRFLKTGSATTLARKLIAEDVRNRYNKLTDKGILYKMLNNPVYIGGAVHKGVSCPDEHIGIVDRKIWDGVQARFQQTPRKRAAATRAQTPSLLKGIIFGPTAALPCCRRTHERMAGSIATISARLP